MTTTDIRNSHKFLGTKFVRAVTDPNPRTGQPRAATHDHCAGTGPYLPDGHGSHGTQSTRAVGDLNSRNDQNPTDAHDCRVVAGATSELAIEPATPNVDPPARDSTRPDPDTVVSRPTGPTLDLADPLLALAADVLDDLERVRIANENRLRQLTRDETDKDGEDRGFGLTLDHPDVRRLAVLVETLAKAEHDAELNLARMVRRHPLGPWAKTQRGVGDKQIGRLLAAIGDPYIRPEMHRANGVVEPSRPRTVSELWAFCGYHTLPSGHGYDDTQSGFAAGVPLHNVAARRRKGVKSNWSSNAKMRAFNIAESTGKQLVAPCHALKGDKGEYIGAVHVDDCACSPYRVLYDHARTQYVGTLHPEDCTRCGPGGKPALVGSPRSAKHQHQMAIRRMSKAILKDLWRQAKRIHTDHPGGHRAVYTQNRSAVGVPHDEPLRCRDLTETGP